MSEQEQERKTWAIDDSLSQTWGYAVIEDGNNLYLTARVLSKDVAQQVVDDHNIRPQLEARIAELETQLREAWNE